MKNWICTIAIVLFLAAASRPAFAATKVFLLAGQSNMGGNGVVAGLPAPYNVQQTAVNFWSANAWGPLKGGFGNTPAHFGPEVTFGYTLRNLFPTDNIYLVKYGLTSTSLAVQWNPNGTGACYNTFKTTAKAAIDNLRNAGLAPTIAGMIWMQGEEDTYTDATAAAYEANLKNLISSVRRDFETPDMEFVIGRILSTTGPGANNTLVQHAQMTVPGEVGHASWFTTDDLQNSGGHYGTQGQIDLGIRFANQFVQTPEPSCAVLSGIGLVALTVYGWYKRAKHA